MKNEEIIRVLEVHPDGVKGSKQALQKRNRRITPPVPPDIDPPIR